MTRATRRVSWSSWTSRRRRTPAGSRSRQVSCRKTSAGHQKRPTSMTAPAAARMTAPAGAPIKNAIATMATTAHWWTLRAVTSNKGSSNACSLTFGANRLARARISTRCSSSFGEPRVDHDLAQASRVQELVERGRNLPQPYTGSHDAPHPRPGRQQPERFVEVFELGVDAAGHGDLARDPEHRHQRHFRHGDPEQHYTSARQGKIERLLDRLRPA